MVFVDKSDWSFITRVNYRPLNHLTMPNKYLLLLIRELFVKTSYRKYFTRLELKNMCKLIGIATGDEWKTALHTQKVLLEYIVLWLGVTNANTLFQQIMHTTFYNVQTCICFLDDILIYSSNTSAKHQAIVAMVPQQCVQHPAAANLLKGTLYVYKTILSRHVINNL